MALSYSQLEGLWIKAGGDPAVASIAAAIVFPESGGNPSALNATDNGGTQSSFGLWQISNGTHTPPSPNWADPLTNAQLAVAKYKGAGNRFTPWGTYDTGAYRQYLQNGIIPDMTAGGAGGVTGSGGDAGTPVSTPSLTNPASWFSSIQGLVYNSGNYLFMGLCIAGGFALIVIGLTLLIRERVAAPTGIGSAARIVVKSPTIVMKGPKAKTVSTGAGPSRVSAERSKPAVSARRESVSSRKGMVVESNSSRKELQ